MAMAAQAIRGGDLMSLIKVKIASVEKIEDLQGKFGPQKKVSIKEACEGGDRWLSGFIPVKDFVADDWKAGKVLELEVWEKEYNGKMYWNFKVPGKTEKKQEEVMVALREIYKKMSHIESLIKALTPANPDSSNGSKRAEQHDYEFGEPTF